jgi:ketosteroid isomerase-like protein
VIVVGRQHGRGHGSGIELETRVIHVWTIRDGKGVGWWSPRTLDEAVEELDDANLLAPLRGYEAFNRGDIPGALADFDPEIEWHTYIVPGPGGGTYRGHDGVKELWNDARNVFGEFRNEPERLISAGDKIVAFVRVCGRGKESGIEVMAKIAHVHTMRDGKVVRIESFEDREEALRWAGLA